MCIFIYEYARVCLYVFMCVGMLRERKKGRERKREREREKVRERERERESVCVWMCACVSFFAYDKNNMKNRNTVKTNQHTHKATKIKPQNI